MIRSSRIRATRRPHQKWKTVHTSRLSAYAFDLSLTARFRVLSTGLVLIAAVLIARLFYWQIVQGAELQAAADRQHWISQSIPANRGKIYTQNKSILVGNQPAYTLYADLTLLKDTPQTVAAQLAPLIPTPPQVSTESATPAPDNYAKIVSLLTNAKGVWVKLHSEITESTKNKITDLGVPGLQLQEEAMRTYPEASMSAHMIGFVGSDSVGMPKGYFGLEGFYDLELTGKPGKLSMEKDASGNPILLGERRVIPGVDGRDLVIHVDRTIQYILEKKLQEGLQRYGAISGSVTVMNPQTGAILGMASWPSYDPQHYRVYNDDLYTNPVVADSFEPGSVFKVLIMAAGINEKVISSNTVCPCVGPEQIGIYSIKTWNEQYHPNSTMTDVLTHSDNVGMVFVARRLGLEKMLKYLDNYGFGQPTGIDLQDELSPKLREPKEWKEIDLATASFGQGIAVTPIQMVTAASAIANGGVIMQPHVVAEIHNGKEVTILHPIEKRRILSSEAATETTNMMVTAARFGEAKWTALKGYQVAGKTGTAQIPVEGHYDEEKTIASFIGFAPADDPKFVMLVTLREPTSSPWGSETAAPLWYEIAKEMLLYWGVQPTS